MKKIHGGYILAAVIIILVFCARAFSGYSGGGGAALTASDGGAELSYTSSEIDSAIGQQYDGDQAEDSGWNDLRFPAERTKKITGKEPKETEYKGGMILEFEDNSSQAIAFNAQMDHGYKLGTDLEFHLHPVLPVAGSGAGIEIIKWDFTYSWAEIGAVMPAETTISKEIDIQNMSADTHFLWDIGSVLTANMATNSGVGVSSMLVCSLTRDHTVVNNSSKHVYLMEADFHYQIDQERGSRTEYTK